MTEDRLARIHREYKEECIALGKYKPLTEEELAREQARWKAECQRPPKKQATRRKHPPKGHAD